MLTAKRLLLAIVMSLGLVLGAQAQLHSIGIAGDGEFTRITLVTETELRPDTFMVSDQDGLKIEFAAAALTLARDPFLGEPTGGILAYTLETDRITFELDQPMMIMRELDLPPTGSESMYRYILDLSRVSETRFMTAVARDERRALRRAEVSLPDASEPMEAAEVEAVAVPNAPTRKPSVIGTLMEAARQRHVVVIDPGHGGRDPGALSIVGGKESDVVLKTALIIKEELARDPRYIVYLTRETDVYIEHEDRVTKARNWGADLFISIHADAAGAPTVEGASVYTISTRGEARIEGASQKYGWEMPFEDGTPEEISDILQDLTVRETKSNSTIFAELLVPELGRAGPLLRNTHRQKNLFVLLAPDVPAVLVEIGFLTNKQDARRLKSKTGRRKSAQAIKRAIDAYFDRQDLLFAGN